MPQVGKLRLREHTHVDWGHPAASSGTQTGVNLSLLLVQGSFRNPSASNENNNENMQDPTIICIHLDGNLKNFYKYLFSLNSLR